MKKMIKKVLGFVTIGNVSVLLVAMVGVCYLFIKRFETAILYLLLAIALLVINFFFKKYGGALKLAKECNDNEKKAIDLAKELNWKNSLNFYRARLYEARYRKERAFVEYCKFHITSKELIRYTDDCDRDIESAKSNIYKLEKELLDDSKDNN